MNNGLTIKWTAAFAEESVHKDHQLVYNSKQRQHHLKQRFEDEYLVILRKREIEFDERYVFEPEIIG
jgi:hypothetical protein